MQLYFFFDFMYFKCPNVRRGKQYIYALKVDEYVPVIL